jgi:hypothetical protein
VKTDPIAFGILAIMWAGFGAWLIRARRREAAGEVIRYSWRRRILGVLWFLACIVGSMAYSLARQGFSAGQILAALALYGDSWGSWNPGVMRAMLVVVYGFSLLGVVYPQSWIDERIARRQQ